MTTAVSGLSVPDSLAELDQWVLWRYEERGGKRTKVPCQTSGSYAKTDDPGTWSALEAVITAWTKAPKKFAGIGFVFSEVDPFAGIDLDDCLEETTGALKPWARPIIETFHDTYMEISPSGFGVKVWCKASLPGPGQGKPYYDGEVELYDRGRYFTFTGQVLNGAPLQVEDHQTDIARLYALISPATPEQAPNGRRKAKVDLREQKIFHEGERFEYLRSVAAQYRAKGMDRGEILAALSAVNAERCRPPKPDDELRKLADWAATLDPGKRYAASTKAEPGDERPPEDAPDLLTGFEPEDVGNAQRLIALHGPRVRYCYAFNKWLAWDTRRWEVDDSDRARELTHQTMTTFAHQAVKANSEALQKFAAGCRRAARITNAMREAQPYLAIQPADLDTHPDLLNFLNGTVDLKTSRLMPHNPDDFITKLVRHDYRPEAKCPTFLAFLHRIMANHLGLIAYLQKALGYSLTGHTSEKAVFLLHGIGDNGKTTLLALFLALLEEYAVLLQIDTLMVRQESNNTQADLADLRGARFVMTSETEEGQRLAEGKLKRITQGMGRIKATRKYENPVEFPESHKLWIDANHLPVIRGTDNAIWNRLHPVPFDVTIPKGEQDKKLPAKLLLEAEGILAWAVEGAARWYTEGLGKPSDVQQAGDAWRTQSDHIGRFIAEACIIGEYAQVKARHLYQTYKKWADDGGEHPISEMAFGLRISENYPKKRSDAGIIYAGIGRRTDL
jgi:putative DNA primase/helicase